MRSAKNKRTTSAFDAYYSVEFLSPAALKKQSAGMGHNRQWPVEKKPRGERMYAIAFDLDQEMLKAHYPGATHTNSYEDIRRVLEAFGFHRKQGSVYFGNESVTPVTCVMAVQEIQRVHNWFAKAVSDIRMLRIEEHNDLMPAIAKLELPLAPPGAAD